MDNTEIKKVVDEFVDNFAKENKAAPAEEKRLRGVGSLVTNVLQNLNDLAYFANNAEK